MQSCFLISRFNLKHICCKSNLLFRWNSHLIDTTQKYNSPLFSDIPSLTSSASKKRDCIIIGGGHNGLITACYLARQGIDCLVLERRHMIGGAAITEEIYKPGYKYSRASYLAGLLRPEIIEDLYLEKHGFKYIPRDFSSFTPTKEVNGKYLLLGKDDKLNYNSIAQFSVKDAEAFPEYEQFLGRVRDIIQPLLDSHPPDLSTNVASHEFYHSVATLVEVFQRVWKHRSHLSEIYEFMTAPAEQILNRWFESDFLKATLATDAVIGSLASPKQNGSAYVLLHHVMGEAAGRKGVWAYVEGGMGKITECISKTATQLGVEIQTNATVSEIVVVDKKVNGVRMQDGTFIQADRVVSATTPYHTFIELLPKDEHIDYQLHFPKLFSEFRNRVRNADYSCGSMKINCVVDKLPNFKCYPTKLDSEGRPIVGINHLGTVHFEESMSEINDAFSEAIIGKPASRPVIEMTIPSSLDKTLIPLGSDHHIVQFFIQYVPYDINSSHGSWEDEKFKQAYANNIFNIVDEFCVDFSSSILHADILSPRDLEKIFGLHKGNIFHGSLGLHQLGYTRPVPNYSSYRSPIDGLYLGASGAHPGGGVMGAVGKNCARIILSDIGLKLK